MMPCKDCGGKAEDVPCVIHGGPLCFGCSLNHRNCHLRGREEELNRAQLPASKTMNQQGKHTPIESPDQRIARDIYNALPTDEQAREGEMLKITPAQMRSIVETTIELAAAPDLLEACEHTVAAYGGSNLEWPPEAMVCIERLQQAIR